MHIRELQRRELDSVWSIDRSEVIEAVYYFENGELTLKPEHHDHPGWSPAAAARYGPMLRDCFDRGGTFFGAFEGRELVAFSVLDNRFIGEKEDQLQLVFLHVSRAYRGRGLGVTLFNIAAHKARELGARKLYVSSTPSEHTVEFYLRRGCTLAEEIDPVLFDLEPDDIHLQYVIP